MKTQWRAILIIAGVLLAAALAWGQVSTSSISGVVQDESGAVVPGAKVVAQNEGTGIEYQVTTTSAGVYSIESVPVGNYTIIVTASGFQTFKSVHNVLTVGSDLVVNAALKVGAMTQVVQVESTYERVESTHAMVGDLMERRAIVDLPLNGRNPLNLIVLQPGLVQRTTGGAGSGTHVFGSRDRAHNVTIDGIDANESSVPNPQGNFYRLNPDNVQEYRVVTHNATPEFGRNSGANVTIATRAGTNDFHGDVFWFHRNTVLNSNEWFNSATGIEKPVLLLNQFGAEGGGPILKNKTFFYVSWQGNRIKQTMPIASAFGTPTIYTASLKSGLFRYFVRDPNVPFVLDGVTITRNSPRLVDPETGALRSQVPVCGGTVTTNCVATYNIFANDPAQVGADPAIAGLVGQIPLPNRFDLTGDGLNFASYVWNPPSRFVGPHYLFRVDHKFNDDNNLFVRYLKSDWNTTEGDFLNSRPKVYPGFPPLGEVTRATQGVAISYRRVFSPAVVNEFTTGFSRFHFFFTWGESNPNFPNVPAFAQECTATSFRTVNMPYCNTPHTERAVSNIQFIDNLSYVRAAHTLRMGTNIRLYRHNDVRGFAGGFNMMPTIIFDRSVRAPGGIPPGGTSEVLFPSASGINTSDNINLLNAISELVGIPARVTQGFVADLKSDAYVGGLQALGTRAKQFNFYFQDEWKLRRNLTMTYGLRWEVNLAPSDGGGRAYVPDKPVDGSQGTVTYVNADRWFDRNNVQALAPRISFAWDPFGTGKTAIRLGYGIAFDTVSTFQATAIGGKVPGAFVQCRIDVQGGAPAGCIDIPNNLRLTQFLDFMKSVSPSPSVAMLPNPTTKPSVSLKMPNQVFGTAPNVGAFDPNLKLPTVHEWSLTIQRELPWAFVAQIGYIGKRGIRLFHAYDLNQIRTNQPGFLQSFLIAQSNLKLGCRPDGTNCPSGVTGQTPTLLLQLVPASTLNSSSYVIDIGRNGLGDLARRIDQTNIVARGFPANYFRPNAQFSEIFYMDSGGTSHYHGLIAQLRRRFERGLEFGLAYTFSKSIDDMSVDPVGASSGGGLSSTNSRTPTDVRNFGLDRSVSDFDNTHVLVAHGVYELPFGRGRTWGGNLPGIVNHFLGGWGVTGIFTLQSGEPFTINSGVRTANGYKVSRADLVGPKPSTDLQFLPGITGPVVFQVSDLDPVTNCRQVVGTQSFFCVPAPGTNGMGRNAFRGPGFRNFDLGVTKKFTVTERVSMQFRTEFFNVFNHPNFENPRNASIGSPTLTSSVFGQTCCSTSALISSTSVIAIGEPNRVIQFALKVSF